MFNASDIQEFKLVWIAGTMNKKLGKKQVSAIDISRTIDRIVSKEYQLRTNSQLMLGIMKIYKIKTDYLYADAHHTLLQFKRFFTQSQDKSIQVQEARQEAITIQQNEILNDLDPEGVFKVPLPFGMSLNSSFSSLDDLVKSSPFQSLSSPHGSIHSFQSIHDISRTPIGSLVGAPNTPGLSSIKRASPFHGGSVLSKSSSYKSIILQESSPHHFLLDHMTSSSDRLDVLSQHEVDLFQDLRDDFQLATSQDFDIHHDENMFEQDEQPPVVPDSDFDLQFQTLTSQPGTPVHKKGGLLTPKTSRHQKSKKNMIDPVIYLDDHEMHEMKRLTELELVEAPLHQYQESQKEESKRIVAQLTTSIPFYLHSNYKDLIASNAKPFPKRIKMNERRNEEIEHPIDVEVGRFLDYDDFPIYQEASPVS
jgi:hypothetical protein